jgi:16S rRNA (cytosine967-C5)-methyltransferase
MPAEPALQLAVQTSLAPALVERWIALVGFENARRRAYHTLVMPPIIVVGVDDRTDPRLEPHEAPGAAVYVGPSGELGEVLAALPGTRVQDPSSAMAVSITASLKPRCIIDVCAGRGTKTRQLAALHPEARIIATDVDPARHEVLSHVFEGHPRVQVVPFDQLRTFDAQAELLVLDVPCSNTGVLARRLEARHRFSERSLEALLRLQRQIAADTWPLLADRAVVLYATCSIDPEENERQAAWLVKHHRMRLLEETFVEPCGGPGGPASGYRDGAYAAMLEKP